MKFPSLKIENFLSIEKAELNLADRGLVVIHGANEDNTSAVSNGAGKSSIADALYWCLTGETARGLSGDAVVRREVGKGTMVEAVVADVLDTYVIRRHRKHKTGKNGLQVFSRDTLANVDTELTKGTDKLTQELVYQIIGCSNDVFRAAAYAAQGQMPDLPGMTDKQLKMLVEEAAGVTVLEAAYKEASARVSTAKGKLMAVDQQLDTASTTLTVLRDSQQGMIEGHEKWEDTRKFSIGNCKTDAQNAATLAKAVAGKLLGYSKSDTEAEIAKLTAHLAGVQGERENEQELLDEVRRAETVLTALQQQERGLTRDATRFENSLSTIDDLIGKPCGECGKEYCEHDLESARKIAQEKNQKNHEELNKAKVATLRAAKIVKDAQGQLSAYRGTMTDVTQSNAALSALNALASDMQRVMTQRDIYIKTAKGKIDEIKALEAQANPFDAQIAAATAKMDAEKKRIEALKDSQKKLRDEVVKAETVAKVFSPSGVRAHILDEVTPFLNDQTAKYLGSLTDGNSSANWTTLVKTAKGELREKFSIEVSDKTGGESFAALSGGEQRKVRIAASLALQDLVARRATKPLEIFIGDEIDDALDEAGLERLTSILEEKAKERGTVLIISHHDLRDWISNTITVTKKNQKSTIEENIV